MKTKYQVKLVKGNRITELENIINTKIEEMGEKRYNLKDVKQFNYDKYVGYTIILVFYKL